MPLRLPAAYSEFKDLMELRRYLDELVREIENYTSIEEEESFRPIYSKITASTQAIGKYTVYLSDATAGSITISLPDANKAENAVYTFKKTDASGNFVRFQSSTANIDGASTLSTTTRYVSYTVLSDGTSWQIISKVV
jgi:hypothetical protein